MGGDCGIGPTKTLANHVAKRAECKPGSYPAQQAQACKLGARSEEELQAVLVSTEVGEVWGVGRRISAQLNEAGIHTVLDLDGLNQRDGRGTLLMAGAGLGGGRRVWRMRQERRTPRYTTYLEEMPVARM